MTPRRESHVAAGHVISPYDAHTGSWPIRSAVTMSGLTILESAVGASGPTTGASFSILKA